MRMCVFAFLALSLASSLVLANTPVNLFAYTAGGGSCVPGPGTFGIDANAGANPVSVNSGGASTLNITISTTNCPDEVIVGIVSNATPTSVTSANLSFTQRLSEVNGPSTLSEWIAQATSPLSSESVTITLAASAYITVSAVAYTGIHSSAPFESGLIPGGSNTTACTWTTSNANDGLLVYELAAGDLPATGWTLIGSGTNFLAGSTKVVTATQSAVSSNTAFQSGGPTAAICDALVQGP